MSAAPEYITLTPTWRAAVDICIAALEYGTETGKRAARAELRRLAEHVDRLQQAPECVEVRS